MELSLSATQRGAFARRAAPICCGGALAAGAVYIATHDPGAAGARYPACIFHQMTGLWCPGCGLTRGTHQLLHGDVASAFSYNVFTPFVLAAIVVAWFVWLRSSWGAPSIHMPQSAVRWFAVLAPALLLAYAILRNIPVAALRTLAP